MSDLVNLNLSAQVLLFAVFPAVIIGLGVAYGVKQWRDSKRRDQQDDER